MKIFQKYLDAVICWDFSVINLCKKLKIPFHISTQASISNQESALFFKKLGAERIVLARELSLKQIEKEDITEAVSTSLALSSKNKERLINENIPKIFRSQFYEFAGTKGSNYVYNALKNREKVYIRYLFKKP